jgi:hypothetical protein
MRKPANRQAQGHPLYPLLGCAFAPIGKGRAGVLVHPEKWNQLIAELSRLRRIIRADPILAAMKAGKYTEEL